MIFPPKVWWPILNASTKFKAHHKILKMFHNASCDMYVRVFLVTNVLEVIKMIFNSKMSNTKSTYKL